MEMRPKLLLLIPHLGGGGAEKVITLLLRNLCPHKYELHLGLITAGSVGQVALPSHVSVHALGASRTRGASVRLLALVWSIQPDLIVSGMAHLNFLVLLLRPLFPRKTRILVRQNATISAALTFGESPWYTGLFYRHLYRHADRIVCQTHEMARDTSEPLGLQPHQKVSLIAVAPNPVDLAAIRDVQLPATQSKLPWRGFGPHLLAVGRLAREKGFDLLLRALRLVRREFPYIDLTLVGSGPEDASLKRLAHELDLDSVVYFTGRVETPAVYYAGATAFVSSSLHEGMPNALLEAASGGLPLVATPSCSGLTKLLAGRPGVWIAEAITCEALASSILAALHALHPGQRFPHEFIAEFELDRSIATYGKLFDDMIERGVGERVP
jgi:glycosyltransferase involved in cell wall biosynthesis